MKIGTQTRRSIFSVLHLAMGIFYPIAVFLTISVALAGCMPLPWKSDEPRVAEQELKPFTIGVSTREEVEAALGKPDLVRRNNQLWIYGWVQGRGMVVGMVPVELFALAPFYGRLYHTHHVLFIEFDTTGVLHDIDLVGEENACSKGGVCVKHWGISFGLGSAAKSTIDRLDESWTIVTASRSEDQRARHFRPNKHSCGFYLFANEEIEDKKFVFSIDGYKDKPLYEDSYVFLQLTPGPKSLLLSRSPSSLRYHMLKKFECDPGDVIYVAASVKRHFSSGKFDPIWTVDLVTQTEWRERIKDKELQLLDNPHTGEFYKTVQQRIDQLKQVARSQRQKEEVMRHFALDPSTKPIPTSEEDKRAKTLRPKQGEALIYFYQDKGTDAEKCAQPLILYSGQNPIGRSTTNGYSIAFVSAGLFEYMLKQTPWKRVTLEDLGTYYLRARWTYKKRSSGGGCSVNIEMVPDDEGMASLKERSVVDIMRYHNNEIFIIR